MIELVQHKIQDVNLLSYFNKLDEITLSINRELVERDLVKLKDMLKNLEISLTMN